MLLLHVKVVELFSMFPAVQHSSDDPKAFTACMFCEITMVVDNSCESAMEVAINPMDTDYLSTSTVMANVLYEYGLFEGQ